MFNLEALKGVSSGGAEPNSEDFHRKFDTDRKFIVDLLEVWEAPQVTKDTVEQIIACIRDWLLSPIPIEAKATQVYRMCCILDFQMRAVMPDGADLGELHGRVEGSGEDRNRTNTNTVSESAS